MTKFAPKEGIIIVDKYEDKELNNMMVVTENEDDKNLFTCIVVAGNDKYDEGDIVVVGRYSLFKLNFSGTTTYFLEEDDILAKIIN